MNGLTINAVEFPFTPIRQAQDRLRQAQGERKILKVVFDKEYPPVGRPSGRFGGLKATYG